MRVRIQSAAIKHFRNVCLGKIRFPCNLASDTFSMKSDILGIYGQNGSGKTTFIDALEVLKCLLSGLPIKESLENCISKGHNEAELTFEFSVEDDQGHKFRAVYSAQMGLDYLNESLKVSVLQSGEWTRMNLIMESRSTDTKSLITPDTKKKELFGKDPQILDELRVTKRLCAKEHRSFLFSNEVFDLLLGGSGSTLWYCMLAALRHFAGASLFVVNNRGAGLSTMGTELPVIYQKENSLGHLKLPLDQPAIIPAIDFSIARKDFVASDKIIAAVNEQIKLFRGNVYKPGDFCKVVHLADTDGAFIPEGAVIEEAAEGRLYPFCTDTQILTPEPANIIDRNAQKSRNIAKLSSTGRIGGIPYSFYYFSCNLDHVLHGRNNLSEAEKIACSRAFDLQYADAPMPSSAL